MISPNVIILFYLGITVNCKNIKCIQCYHLIISDVRMTLFYRISLEMGSWCLEY